MTEITNPDAVEYKSNFEICQRSGRRAKPGKLIKDPYTNAWVLPEYADRYPEQLFTKVRAESLTGSARPEQDDNFIDSITDPADI